MAKKSTKKNNKTINKWIVGGIIAGVAVFGAIIATIVAVANGGKLPNVTIEYGEQKGATITFDNGYTTEVDVPTVEYVDVNEAPQTKTDDEEHGLGAWYNIDVTTPTTVKDSTIGRCINIDNYAGSQCWDLSAAVAETQTGRRLSTCGTGAASGMMNCWGEQAREDYDVIWDSTQIRPGDILVFGGGQYGHTGVAMGYYNNGYVTLLSANQGGGWCDQGGAAVNIINMSTRDFIGAYRWKAWNYLFEKPAEPEPEPVIPVSNCTSRYVNKGDTMSKYMLECENTVVYGSAIDAYAKTWFSTVVKPGQSVYDGWHSESGVGLYYTDTVEHRF